MLASRMNAAPAPDAAGSARSTQATATIYTCPMHPLVRHTGPGRCPICGMRLEVFVPKVGGDDIDPQLFARTWRLWLAASSIAVLGNALRLRSLKVRGSM